MPALMSEQTVQTVGDALRRLRGEQDSPFAVVLHGGEPLMLGHRRLGQVLQELRNVLPAERYPLSIQTNGTLITADILDLCADLSISLSVSLDGTKAINDRFRIGKRGEGTHDDAVRGIRLLRAHRHSHALFSGSLPVINPFSSSVETYR